VLGCYERATWAIINIAKSQEMALGSWDTARRVLDLPCRDEVGILGHAVGEDMAHGADFPDTTRVRPASHVGDGMAPFAWSSISCAHMEITEKK
jgi:hypothetical protein